jgi:GT2 family glycosyltransferase
MTACGVVVIGRNEGDRLRHCLASLREERVPVVYVDSCSQDGSAEWAASTGVVVVELDGSRLLSAARARNEGFQRLLIDHPGLECVQFVDGDCEICPGWLARGMELLSVEADLAIVCGNVRERDPSASVYALLCNLEWQRQPGLIEACGGIFMARTTAFRAVGGFRSDLMAGEEPELCLRLRRAGWKIRAVADEMALHDAAMVHFRQWWTRSRRAGVSYAQGATLHGASPDRHYRKECRSLWFWGLGLPAASLVLALPTRGLSLAGFVAYLVLGSRVFRWGRRRGWSLNEASLYAAFIVLFKYAAIIGMLQYYHRTKVQKRPMGLVEHKESGVPRHRRGPRYSVTERK